MAVPATPLSDPARPVTGDLHGRSDVLHDKALSVRNVTTTQPRAAAATERGGAEGPDRAHDVPVEADKHGEERSPEGRAVEKPQVDQWPGGSGWPIPALAVWGSKRCSRPPQPGSRCNQWCNDGVERRRSRPAMPGQRSKGSEALTGTTVSVRDEEVAGPSRTRPMNAGSPVVTAGLCAERPCQWTHR
jgi:hypothetical protein